MMQTAHRNFHRERTVFSMLASAGVVRWRAASTVRPASLPTDRPPPPPTLQKTSDLVHKTGLTILIGLFSRPQEETLWKNRMMFS